ncbi:phosphoribosylglycinamide formyltransferase [Pragia fontium]|uniref:Phosphoribosylglycinamide formyltransferase n=1 Tax=Pragia fontium TaxID=82985 RepID=A0ABQ5LIN2_9GAMM|nr:DUF4198 domain-containing protein [Pragia fontium]GKX63471.1 phosphoribosylglycinamide formyltransferase [Pragia fontium]
MIRIENIIRMALIVLPLAYTTAANSHSLWVNQPTVESGKTVVVEMGYGDEFPTAEPIVADRLHIFAPMKMIGAAGELTLLPGNENYQFVSKKPITKGSYLVLATYNPTFWSKNAKGWKQQSRNEMSDASYCEVASMFGKTLIDVDQANNMALLSEPQGQKLEMIPLANPSLIKPGQPFPIQVLYDGKPAKNIAVSATFAGFGDPHEHHGHTHSHAQAFLNKTDGQGKVNIYPLKAGYWIASVEYKSPFEDKTQCDEYVTQSTLTFTITE